MRPIHRTGGVGAIGDHPVGGALMRYMAILVLGILLLAGCVSPGSTSGGQEGKKVTVFKSPTCGCCVKYISYLEGQGYDVEVVATQDMNSIKQEYGIPRSMESCHTAVIGDYFIEGHVPIEAVNALMAEEPAIEGIALPAMPAGSPGMPGVQAEPFRIYALTGGNTSEYMVIGG